MKIRKARKEDLKKLIELDKISNKEIKWWAPMTKSEFVSLIKKGLVYVAENDKELIAYLNGDIKEKQLILDNIYVRKEYRRKGIARELIKKFMSDCKKSKFKDLRIDCPERLRKFYEKFGFKTTALIMKRRLR